MKSVDLNESQDEAQDVSKATEAVYEELANSKESNTNSLKGRKVSW